MHGVITFATFALVAGFIFFVVAVLPLMVILHYVTKWKATKGLSSEEQQLLEELWKASEAMDSRLDALETILSDEVPESKKAGVSFARQGDSNRGGRS